MSTYTTLDLIISQLHWAKNEVEGSKNFPDLSNDIVTLIILCLGTYVFTYS